MDRVRVSPSRLSVEEVTDLVSSPSSGAISLFIGTTRDNFNGRKVVSLEYESYVPMAESELKKICQEIRQQWEVDNIAIYHRLGVVPLKEASVIIAVSSTHRNESLEAVQYGINTLKSRVPIWKKEFYADEEATWKENKECLWKSQEGTSQEINSCTSISTINRKQYTDHCSYSGVKSENMSGVHDVVPSQVVQVDPDLIQIKAGNEELQRRIEAFIKRKREEVDITNVQEFCGRHISELGDVESCARIDAVLERRKDSKSHLRVTRVVNPWGPQTRGIDPGSVDTSAGKCKVKQELASKKASSLADMNLKPNAINKSEHGQLPQGVEERLYNVEEHLQLKLDGPVPKDIYTRLKRIEDRIIFLEGLSPEYFREPLNKQMKTEVQSTGNGSSQVYKKYTLPELSGRIEDLRMKLIAQSKK